MAVPVSKKVRVLIDWKKETRTIIKGVQESVAVNILAADQYQSAIQPPQNLSVVSVEATSANLDWEAPSNGTPDSYTVYVFNNTQGSLEQTITGILLTEVEVLGLTTDDEYEFWVTAVRGGVESAESNHVTATPVQLQPDAPENLSNDDSPSSYALSAANGGFLMGGDSSIGNGIIYGDYDFDLETATSQWQKDIGTNHAGRVAILNDEVAYGVGDDGSSTNEGNVYMTDLDGVQKWTKSGYGNIVTVSFTPDGDVFVMAVETTKTISKLSGVDGTEIFSHDLAYGVDLRAIHCDAEGNIYTAGRNLNVRKYDSDFNLIWTSPDTHEVISTNSLAITPDGEIYLSDNTDGAGEHYCRRLDADDGSIIWELDGGIGLNDNSGRGLLIHSDSIFVIRWRDLIEVDFDGNILRTETAWIDNGVSTYIAALGPDHIMANHGNKDYYVFDVATLTQEYIVDANGDTVNWGNCNPRSFDTHPGTMNITSSPQGGNLLTWNEVADADGYNVYVNKDGAGYIKQNSSLITDTQYKLGELEDGDYEVYVKAVKNGIESDPSNIVEISVGFEISKIVYKDSLDVISHDYDSGTEEVIFTSLSSISALDIDFENDRIFISRLTNSNWPQFFIYRLSDGVQIFADGTNEFHWSLWADRVNNLISRIAIVDGIDNVEERDYDGGSLNIINSFGANCHHITKDSEGLIYFYVETGTNTIFKFIDGQQRQAVYTKLSSSRFGIHQIEKRIYFTEGTTIKHVDYNGSDSVDTGVACTENTNLYCSPAGVIFFNRSDGTYAMKHGDTDAKKVLNTPLVNSSFCAV